MGYILHENRQNLNIVVSWERHDLKEKAVGITKDVQRDERELRHDVRSSFQARGWESWKGLGKDDQGVGQQQQQQAGGCFGLVRRWV